MKAMNNHNNVYGFFFGMIGGFTKYLASIDMEVFSRMIEAAATALVCGFLGMAGKEGFVIIKRKYFTKKHK